MRALKLGTGQLRALELGIVQNRALELGPAEARALEPGPGGVEAAGHERVLGRQIRARQLRRAGAGGRDGGEKVLDRSHGRQARHRAEVRQAPASGGVAAVLDDELILVEDVLP